MDPDPHDPLYSRNGAAAGPAIVSMYSVTGELVFRGEMSGREMSIGRDKCRFVPGVYVAEARFEAGICRRSFVAAW